MVADDDHVVIHYRMPTPGDPGDFVVMAIFRIVDGIVTEHWDAVQPLPSDDPDDVLCPPTRPPRRRRAPPLHPPWHTVIMTHLR